MCGSGQTTEFLLSLGARVTGLDIAVEQIASFRTQWPQCNAVCASILDSGLDDESFDCVVVVGGLHHLPPRVEQAVDEIYRVLKPGGYFCFCEPHAGSFPDWVRRRWYRHDPLFEKNEEAIDLAALERQNRSRFEFVKKTYVGNIAYLLVLNSLIFRIPARIKPLYTPLLFPLESAIGALQSKRLSCVAVCQWRKTGAP
jgi:SAM-dependent methyltransferase